MTFFLDVGFGLNYEDYGMYKRIVKGRETVIFDTRDESMTDGTREALHNRLDVALDDLGEKIERNDWGSL